MCLCVRVDYCRQRGQGAWQQLPQALIAVARPLQVGHTTGKTKSSLIQQVCAAGVNKVWGIDVHGEVSSYDRTIKTATIDRLYELVV